MAPSTSEDCDENFYYVPVAMCIATSSSFVDVFREILENLYEFLIEIALSDRITKNQLFASMEFMRTACMLINDLVLPPESLAYKVKIGGKSINFPISNKSGIGHSEKAVAVLLDLLDIKNIIEIWENILLCKTVFFTSCDEYVIYLVIEAFKQIIFPFKWPFYIIPVLGPGLKDYLAVPVPILIGFNSNLISIDEALLQDPKASIIDIDSNILYTSHQPLFCMCEKNILSKKLQLLKTYYYVDYDRFRSYRMNSLESNIQDKDFLQTLKSLHIIQGEAKEKIFVDLVRHVFLEYFTSSLQNLKQFFRFDSLTQKMEFISQEFLASIITCSECSMETFWSTFIQSNTFNEFLRSEDRSDDNNLKRFMHILYLISKKQYKIHEIRELLEFEVEKVISPRKFIKILKQDQAHKVKSFKHDSRKILLVEIQQELQCFKDYYKASEGIGKFTHRKISFSNSILTEDKGFHSIYYGKYGIIKLSSVLLGLTDSVNFVKLSRVNDHLLSKIDELDKANGCFSLCLLKLYYLIKGQPSGWKAQEVIDLLEKIKRFEKNVIGVTWLFTDIMQKIIEFFPDLSRKTHDFGKLANFVLIFHKNKPELVE